MVKMNPDNLIGSVFCLGGLITTLLVGLLIGELEFAFLFGTPSSIIAFFSSKYLVVKFRFEALAETKSLEYRGAIFGVTVVILSMLAFGLFFGVLSAFVIEGPGIIFTLLSPLSFLVMASVISFGTPYLMGAALGVWVAHYKFNQHHHNQAKQAGTR